MTPDPLRLDETRKWMELSRDDLQTADILIAARRYSQALFLCQQAAEKALKGFLTFHQRSFAKTHDLEELRPECVSIDSSLQAVISQPRSLSKYAWRFRYPGFRYKPDENEAKEAFQKPQRS